MLRPQIPACIQHYFLGLDLGKRVTEPELLPTQAIATGGAS